MIRKLIALALGAIAAMAWANTPPTATFELDAAEVEPGAAVTGAVVVRFAPGLHGYQNPPSEDYMIPVAVSGEGFSLTPSYPRGQMLAVGGATEPVAVYNGTTRIPVRFTAPAQPGAQELTVRVNYQQCDDSFCYAPASVTATASLTVALPTPEPVDEPDPVAPEPEADEAPEQEDEAVEEEEDEDATEEEVDAELPETTFGPEETVADLYGVELDALNVAIADDTTEEADAASEHSDAAEEEDDRSFLTAFIEDSFGSGNYLAIVLAGLVTGLALCLTPCVYPMIPITISFFSGQAKSGKSNKLALGLLYALGIAITYGAVGGIFAALGGIVGELFTYPWFMIALALLMFGLGLSMFGLYEIGIPPFIAKHLKGRQGPAGALIMGLLMGFAAAPCAGAFVSAAALVVAESESVPLGVMMFTAIGAGIGLPFIFVAALSAGANALPKAGGWLITVKAVLGMVVLGVGLSYLFIGLRLESGSAQAALAWSVAALAGAAYFAFFDKSGNDRVVQSVRGVAMIGLALIAGTYFVEGRPALTGSTPVVAQSEVEWIEFDDQSFADALASGEVIFIDATANWCTECKVIEENVLNTPEGQELLSQVVPLKIDWSSGVDQAYIDKTAEQFDIVGLPHIVVLAAGGEEVAVVNDLHSTDELRELIERAKAAS